MRNTWVLASLLMAGLLCLGAAGWLAGRVERPVDQPSPVSVSPSDVPPGVRFVMVALGGFRGLLADALWVRASRLQDEGRVFEVAELTEWITRLDPRSPEVWAYHAWNLAYNLASLFPDPADRWRWVKNGIRLLRDEGIPANPRDSRLYGELGWLYADKVAGRWDPAQVYYRASFADEMTVLMGDGKRERAGFQNDPETIARLKAVGLQGEVMAQADEAYGPLDWRLPESHALYWGLRGRAFQKSGSLWCDRLVWVSLTEMVRGGSLYFDPAGKLYLRGPRLDIAVKGMRRCERDGIFATPLTGLPGENFLRESILWLYVFGRTAEADETLAVLRRVPDSGVGSRNLEEAVRQEVALRVKAAGPEAGRELVEGLLTSGLMWKALAYPDVGVGFESLAKLHWDALVSLPDHGDFPAWPEMCRRAQEQAKKELPESRRAAVRGAP